jgi:predicted transcriptional regulator
MTDDDLDRMADDLAGTTQSDLAADGLHAIAKAIDRLTAEMAAIAYAVAGGARHTDRTEQLR